jgi:hypothetical protein
MLLIILWCCYINYCSWKNNRLMAYNDTDEWLLHDGKYILFGTIIELFKLTKELTKKTFL